MSDFRIIEPIWNGRKVGLNAKTLRQMYRNKKFTATIEIEYKDMLGYKTFPHIYLLYLDTLKNKPYAKSKQKGVELIEIPIHDLAIKEFRRGK